MKKWMLIPILLLLIILLSCQKQNQGEQADAGQEQKKDEPSSMAPIAEIMNNKILSSIDEFKKRNVDKGVILILEALMLFSPRTD